MERAIFVLTLMLASTTSADAQLASTGPAYEPWSIFVNITIVIAVALLSVSVWVLRQRRSAPPQSPTLPQSATLTSLAPQPIAEARSKTSWADEAQRAYEERLAPERAKIEQEQRDEALAQELRARRERSEQIWKEFHRPKLYESAREFLQKYHASNYTKNDILNWAMTDEGCSDDGLRGAICLLWDVDGHQVVISTDPAPRYIFKWKVGAPSGYDEGKWWAGNEEVLHEDVHDTEAALTRVFDEYRKGYYRPYRR